MKQRVAPVAAPAAVEPARHFNSQSVAEEASPELAHSFAQLEAPAGCDAPNAAPLRVKTGGEKQTGMPGQLKSGLESRDGPMQRETDGGTPDQRKAAARDKFLAYLEANEKASQAQLLDLLDELQLEFGLSSTRLDVSDPENVSVEFYSSPALIVGGLALLGGTVYHISQSFERNYTVAQAGKELDASEGRRSPETGQPGHPRMHSNGIAAQAEANNVNQNKSAFANAADQNNATSQVLNTAAGQAALRNFDTGASTRENVTVPMAIANCCRYRPPTAGGVARAPIPFNPSVRVTLIIDKPTILKAPLAWYKKYVHIQTAYPRHN